MTTSGADLGLTVEARVVPVISTKKTPFIECFLSHRNNQLVH